MNTRSLDMGLTKGNNVLISKSLNLTNWDLAITLGHEMIHVYHNVSLTSKIREFTKKVGELDLIFLKLKHIVGKLKWEILFMVRQD